MKLQEFVKCERHLCISGVVAAQAVFVITIKDLVIRKATDVQVFVGKTGVQSLINGRESGVATFFGKDVGQALLLFATVGRNINGVVLIQIIRERALDQVEVFVEDRLWSCVKLNLGCSGRSSLRQQEVWECAQPIIDFVALNQQFGLVRFRLRRRQIRLEGVRIAFSFVSRPFSAHRRLTCEAFIVDVVDDIANIFRFTRNDETAFR